MSLNNNLEFRIQELESKVEELNDRFPASSLTGIDLNDMIERKSGMYIINSYGVSNGPFPNANKNGDYSWYLFQFTMSSKKQALQIAVLNWNATGNIYMRRRIDNKWEDWQSTTLS